MSFGHYDDLKGDDYDALRNRNIAARNAMLAELFKDCKKETKLINRGGEVMQNGEEIANEDIENIPPRKRRRLGAKDTNYKRNKKVRSEFHKKYNTRYSSRNSDAGNSRDSESGNGNEASNDGPKLTVMFPWATSFERKIELMQLKVFASDSDSKSGDEDCEDFCSSRRRVVQRVLKSAYDPDNIPSPDEITEEMLENVATKSTEKTYCKVTGTSCHQCRQKTVDTKTVCRSGECVGVRGQFCGPCLRGRYGESAVLALKDQYWACPPCRGLCNCSICRTRNGQRPTGILAPIVQEEGFKSVKDYLEAVDISDT